MDGCIDGWLAHAAASASAVCSAGDRALLGVIAGGVGTFVLSCFRTEVLDLQNARREKHAHVHVILSHLISREALYPQTRKWVR